MGRTVLYKRDLGEDDQQNKPEPTKQAWAQMHTAHKDEPETAGHWAPEDLEPKEPETSFRKPQWSHRKA